MVMVGGYVLCRLKLKWKQFRIQVINQPRRMVTHWPPPLLSTECTVRMSVVRFGRVVSGQRVCKGDPNLLNTLEYNLFAPQIRSVPSRPVHRIRLHPSEFGRVVWVFAIFHSSTNVHLQITKCHPLLILLIRMRMYISVLQCMSCQFISSTPCFGWPSTW